MNNEISVLEEIQKIYSDVSEWLKFLEAKHAGLFAAWTAVLIAVVTMDGFQEWSIFQKAIIIVPILIGCLINLISFIPFLNRSKKLRKLCYKVYSARSDNRVFYQSIFVKTYDEGNDLDVSVERYKQFWAVNHRNEMTDSFIVDYIKQVIEVSTVGTIKAFLFSVATVYTAVVIGIAVLGIIVA